mgnify:CR=1 FL=1
MRGRKPSSDIRDKVLQILSCMDKAYGYEIFYHYLELFPAVHMRSIYYHLRKAVNLNQITIKEIKNSPGDYSWGPTAQRIYYKIKKNTQVKVSPEVQEYFSNLAKEAHK